MSYTNDAERLAYYEAKMNYYASKMEALEGGSDESIAALNARVLAAEEALKKFRETKVPSKTVAQAIADAPGLLKQEATHQAGIATLKTRLAADKAATGAGKGLASLGRSISSGFSKGYEVAKNLSSPKRT